MFYGNVRGCLPRPVAAARVPFQFKINASNRENLMKVEDDEIADDKLLLVRININSQKIESRKSKI